jgi:hypothetical protein
MVQLLGAYNKNHIFNYDNNGFLIQSFNEYIDSMIEFNKYIKEDTKEGNEKTDNRTVFFTFRQIKKDNNLYVYDIMIKEEILNDDNFASGIVEIYYNENDITKIIVNNIENGYLLDKYNNSFNISPSHYMELIYSKSKNN